MRRCLAPLLAVVLSTGCAHSVDELARQTSRAAVDESVNKLTEEDSKQQIANAVTDPRVAESVQHLTDQVTEGVLRALESERAQRQLAKATSVATRAAAQELVATLGAPAVGGRVEALTDEVASAALANLGSKLQQDFLPSLRAALARELAEGGAAGLRNAQLNDALGTTAQNVAYKAVLGVNDGLRTSWYGGDALRGVASMGARWLQLALWALALLALSLLSCAAIAIARTRRARTEVTRLETATLLLATAMRERHGSEETDEIVTVVRDALEKSAQDHQRHGLLGALRLHHR